MRNISFFKKVKEFNSFKRIISDNSSELDRKFNLRIDNASRLYTVLNIPNEVIGEPYNLRKSDIDTIAEKFIKEYSSELGEFLKSKDLTELYTFYEVKKVDKFSYLIVIGYSLFRSDVFYKRLYWRFIPISIASALILSLFYFL